MASKEKEMICPHACEFKECTKVTRGGSLLCLHAEPHQELASCDINCCDATGAKGSCSSIHLEEGRAIILRLKIQGDDEHWGKYSMHYMPMKKNHKKGE